MNAAENVNNNIGRHFLSYSSNPGPRSFEFFILSGRLQTLQAKPTEMFALFILTNQLLRTDKKVFVWHSMSDSALTKQRQYRGNKRNTKTGAARTGAILNVINKLTHLQSAPMTGWFQRHSVLGNRRRERGGGGRERHKMEGETWKKQ